MHFPPKHLSIISINILVFFSFSMQSHLGVPSELRTSKVYIYTINYTLLFSDFTVIRFLSVFPNHIKPANIINIVFMISNAHVIDRWFIRGLRPSGYCVSFLPFRDIISTGHRCDTAREKLCNSLCVWCVYVSALNIAGRNRKGINSRKNQNQINTKNCKY